MVKKQTVRSFALGATAVALLSILSAVSALAGSTSSTPPPLLRTTTLSTSTSAAARAYAVSLMDAQVIPPSAHVAPTVPTPLPATGDRGVGGVEYSAHREYLLPSSVDAELFVRAHLRRGQSVERIRMSTSPNAHPVFYVSVTSTCANPHVSYCAIFYSSTMTATGKQELRIDVDVVWLSIEHVRMPLSGAVTVTGCGTISVSQFFGNPVSVGHARSPAQALRSVIASPKLARGFMCMEGSHLLKIVVTRAKGGAVSWSTSADERPGMIAVVGQSTQATLDDRSREFWHVADSFFPVGVTVGTKQGARVWASASKRFRRGSPGDSTQ